MNEMEYRIHWFNLTVHASVSSAFTIYKILFKDKFGNLETLGHGGRGFKKILHGLLEFKLYIYPTNNEEYFHFEIPGSACDALEFSEFEGLLDLLVNNFYGNYAITRLDIAFDRVPFSPQDVEIVIREEKIRSLAKRKTLKIETSPYEENDIGGIGTYTVYFGSRNSERMIRVYDKRGYTRLELELKDKRASLVAKDIFTQFEERKRNKRILAHLLDFIDIDSDWWRIFIKGNFRAGARISDPRQTSMTKIEGWLDKQVAPALSVAIDVLPEKRIIEMINNGRKKRGPRYQSLLSLGELDHEQRK